jgi:uncharacterized membrane protein
MNVPTRLWNGLRASFWFTPGLIVLASMAAAVGLVELDAWQTADLAAWSPRLFGAGADGSRAMLSAIATSMVTVAGVVFSITIVALSLTATQYSPRVLRTFMRDAPTQAVLGVFVGIFAYCLIVLRAIRGGDEGRFIPSLAVLGGMAYALLGIAVLIYFIHHVARSIDASSILGRIAADTESAVERLFPEPLGPEPEEPPSTLPSLWQVVGAPRSGYITAQDDDALVVLARQLDRVLRIAWPIGAFVVEGQTIAAASGAEPLDSTAARRLLKCVVLGDQRTVEQDAAFGLQQLVDVGLRALSPGVNDPTTACMAVDRIAALLARLATRRIPDGRRAEAGQLRVISFPPEFDSLLGDALDPLVWHSHGDIQVLARILHAIETIAAATGAPARRQVLRRRLQLLQAEAARVRPRARSAALRRRIAELRVRLSNVRATAASWPAAPQMPGLP